MAWRSQCDDKMKLSSEGNDKTGLTGFNGCLCNNFFVLCTHQTTAFGVTRNGEDIDEAHNRPINRIEWARQ